VEFLFWVHLAVIYPGFYPHFLLKAIHLSRKPAHSGAKSDKSTIFVDLMLNTPEILNSFNGSSIEDNLRYLVEIFGNEGVFSTSFGLEDQAVTHILATENFPVPIFTLDTGRLFPETYSTWSSTLSRYGVNITAYYPRESDLQSWISENGPNAFYESVEHRKSCCHIRKVEPLQRALKGKKFWVTGIRAVQSPDRKGMPILEWDDVNGLVKYHPLLHWSDEQLKSFISEHHIPYNPLHDRGFVSIGCAPCTRAIREGEDFRAGRWWWEDNGKKECGLHVKTA
jgi:phosphoadenosine phosphosulfate reductase